jgi:sortase A
VTAPRHAAHVAPRRVLLLFAVTLALLGAWQVAAAGWIHAKAFVAQRLIAAAWATTRDGGPSRRPWPGADLRAVARLTVPARGVDLYVLDNASLRALAFGPAHVGGSASPASWGHTVLVAHRDTHFSFLRRIAIDDEIDVEAASGAPARYRVRKMTVMDRSDARLVSDADDARLTLITCFPFDAVRPGSPLRYVVVAERIA